MHVFRYLLDFSGNKNSYHNVIIYLIFKRSTGNFPMCFILTPTECKYSCRLIKRSQWYSEGTAAKVLPKGIEQG